jgi:hypothetical protein
MNLLSGGHVVLKLQLRRGDERESVPDFDFGIEGLVIWQETYLDEQPLRGPARSCKSSQLLRFHEASLKLLNSGKRRFPRTR